MKKTTYHKVPELKNSYALNIRSYQEFKQIFGVNDFDEFIKIIESHNLEYTVTVLPYELNQ